MKKAIRIVTFIFLSLLLFKKTNGQKTLLAGIAFTADIITDDNIDSYFLPGAGLTYDLRLTKHSGTEGGVFYRNYISNLNLLVGSTRYALLISERHISIPFLYKFRSKIVNLSAGPDFDFYTGWKQRMKAGNPEINSFSSNKNFFLGMQFKLSKQIKLTNKIILEPEFHFIPIINTDYRSYTGFAVHVRHVVKKNIQ